MSKSRENPLFDDITADILPLRARAEAGSDTSAAAVRAKRPSLVGSGVNRIGSQRVVRDHKLLYRSPGAVPTILA